MKMRKEMWTEPDGNWDSRSSSERSERCEVGSDDLGLAGARKKI